MSGPRASLALGVAVRLAGESGAPYNTALRVAHARALEVLLGPAVRGALQGVALELRVARAHLSRLYATDPAVCDHPLNATGRCVGVAAERLESALKKFEALVPGLLDSTGRVA